MQHLPCLPVHRPQQLPARGRVVDGVELMLDLLTKVHHPAAQPDAVPCHRLPRLCVDAEATCALREAVLQPLRHARQGVPGLQAAIHPVEGVGCLSGESSRAVEERDGEEPLGGGGDQAAGRADGFRAELADESAVVALAGAGVAGGGRVPGSCYCEVTEDAGVGLVARRRAQKRAHDRQGRPSHRWTARRIQPLRASVAKSRDVEEVIDLMVQGERERETLRKRMRGRLAHKLRFADQRGGGESIVAEAAEGIRGAEVVDQIVPPEVDNRPCEVSAVERHLQWEEGSLVRALQDDVWKRTKDAGGGEKYALEDVERPQGTTQLLHASFSEFAVIEGKVHS
eukprot:6346-Hanusia_phi.AAC.4